MKRTVVFDLDGALETPYFEDADSAKVQAWMDGHPCGNSFSRLYARIPACGKEWPHFIFNGTFELLRWVNDHGFEIVFFSNAVTERNKALCPILMNRAFEGGKVPDYRVFSREDCADTVYDHNVDIQALDEGLWHGNYKKRLEGVVVRPEDLPGTIMIEDDHSYACKGEEKNFVYGVYGGLAANFISRPTLSDFTGMDFHLPFYFCGMLKRIVDRSEGVGVSLVDAALQIQYGDYGVDFPSDGERRRINGQYIDVPWPSTQRDFRVFVEGLEELRTYNRELGFWCEVDEKAAVWPFQKRLA